MPLTISPPAVLHGVQEPQILLLPPTTVSSAGMEAVDLAASAGLVLDPWERFVLEGALGERGDGKWSGFEVGLIVTRQNGKGAVLEARELAGLFLFGEELILHSAHEFKTAQEAFRRVLNLVQSTPDLDRRVKRVRTSHGEEGIELLSGQRLRFIARSTGSGRGFSGDTVILDEAFHLSPEGMAALLPTMAARPNPQLWYTSSGPLPQECSTVLRRLCRRGRAGDGKSLAYFEWCAAHDPKKAHLVDLDDRENWSAANPGLGIRITEEFVEREREALGADEFARERLGVWPDFEDDDRWLVIPESDWKGCLWLGDRPEHLSAIAFDVTPDRSAGAIAGAAHEGGFGYVDVLDHGPGTGWMVDRLVALKQRHPRAVFCCDATGPAGSLLDPLDKAGLKRVKALSTRDHQQACGGFYDGVMGTPATPERPASPPSVRHRGRPELDAAVAGAEKRTVGDAWLWSRKNSSVDISPLVAATLAHAQGRQKRSLNIDNYR